MGVGGGIGGYRGVGGRGNSLDNFITRGCLYHGEGNGITLSWLTEEHTTSHEH